MPDYSPERSRAALRRTLSSLRKGLGDGSLETNRSTARIAHSDGQLVDVVDFDEFLAMPSDSAGEPAALRSAVNLYRGDFMQGFSVRDSPEFDDWQQRQSTHYRRVTAAAMDRLAQFDAQAGKLDSAVDIATRRLGLDAIHELAHRQLMMLHALAGNRPAALVQYENCVHTLDAELGVLPLEETTALYRRIREGAVKPVAQEHEAAFTPSVIQTEVAIRPGFVGRSQQMAALSTARDQARHGMRVVAIVAEAGFGKTRLLDEFLHGIDGDTPVLRATCFQGEVAIPHSLTVGLLRAAVDDAGDEIATLDPARLAEVGRLLPELRSRVGIPEPPPLDSPGGYLRLLEGAGEVLLECAAGSSPGVVVIDDAHWADEESLRMLGLLTTHHAHRRVLVVVAYRGSEVPADHPMAVVVRDAEGTASHQFAELALGRLTLEEVTQLAQTTGTDDSALAEEVFRLSEGVPFFAVEYLSIIEAGTDAASLPPAVRDLVVGQLARRSDLATQLLDAAAVIGRSFDFDTLRRASGRSDEETVRGLEELMASGFAREVADSGAFDFDHERIRQLVYESMSMVRRRLLHGRVADAMRSRAGSEDGGLGAAGIAAHLLAAGRESEAADHYLIAAEAAAALFANEQALKHYQAALALGHPDIGRIREAIGDLQALAGDYGAALGNLSAAVPHSKGLRKGLIWHKQALVHTRTGDWEMAEAAFETATSLLGDDAKAQSLLETDWAWLSYRKGDPTQALALAERALSDATAADDPVALAQAHNVLGIIKRSDDLATALAHHEESRNLARDLDVTVLAAALNNLALTYLAKGDQVRGLENGLEALELIERIGDRHKAAAVHSNVADLLHAAGRAEESLGHLRTSAELFAEVGELGEPMQPEIWKLSDW